MSDSRLEKFIYAICSMDVTDLPVPLSRIEKLWNCLITGEAPDFEPLSRNEKYLMAMLDRYDISNLPAPMSRGEKLLYKIAVGETDLSDVPGYLSRYEELLKYLIENGGISGGDFEYVLYTINQSLYTLYTTAEKPVKSAILKGQTLVNLCSLGNVRPNDDTNISTTINNVMLLKSNTKYIIKADIVDVIEGSTSSGININILMTNTYNNGSIEKTESIMNDLSTTKINKIFTTTSNTTHFKLNRSYGNATFNNLMILEYQEGMENWDIPYFEGMTSVKMPVLTTTGKNLFDKTKITKNYGFNADKIVATQDWFVSDYIPVRPNTDYKLIKTSRIHIFDENKKLIKYPKPTDGIFTTPTNASFIRINGQLAELDIWQVEEGSTTTSYEPYKTNILSTPSDLELRGIGDVKDTVNCLTGEVVENTIKLTFSGIEKWETSTKLTNYMTFRLTKPSNMTIADSHSSASKYMCDKLKIVSNIIGSTEIEAIWFSSGHIYVRLPKTKASSLKEFKTYLSTNNIQVVSCAKNPIIKTVDLTVVDQDNQPTKLGTFENVTHVSLESAGLIPEVEMEVATNLLEDTVFNLTNAFNTLYPTAAKPVVDGTLYGQTLVNLASEKNTSIGGDKNTTCVLPYKINKMTVYFLDPAYSKFQYFEYNNDGTYKQTLTLNIPSDRVIFISSNNTIIGKIGYYNPNDINTSKNIVVMYGDTRDIKITKYFEGMQSVKMPILTTIGKNLYDFKLTVGNHGGGTNNLICETVELEELTTYTISNNMNYNINIYFKDGNSNEIGSVISGTDQKTITFTTPKGAKYMWFRTWSNMNDTNVKVQMEKGSVATTYEPYKSSILSCNEDVELRKVGEVQDELNVMTGEVVERIGEVVFDGSEDEGWRMGLNSVRINRFYSNVLLGANTNTIKCLCDKYIVPNTTTNTQSKNCCRIESNDRFYIIDTNYNDIESFKLHLQSNPIIVQYVLAENSIKTVDLTVLNQDGNETKLRTFDDTTHVLLNSEGLVPTASLTVRTKIPSASSTSLLMDELSTNQQELETTVDEQSNNVDATMIATTEIYEETL